MLEFKQDDTTAALVLTLTERITLTDANLLFYFKHVLTGNVVTFVKNISQDESNNAGRYNQFTINPAVVFTAAQIGEWHYWVYQQVSGSNIDPTAAGSELENGKLRINRAIEYAPVQYNETQTRTAYNG